MSTPVQPQSGPGCVPTVSYDKWNMGNGTWDIPASQGHQFPCNMDPTFINKHDDDHKYDRKVHVQRPLSEDDSQDLRVYPCGPAWEEDTPDIVFLPESEDLQYEPANTPGGTPQYPPSHQGKYLPHKTEPTTWNNDILGCIDVQKPHTSGEPHPESISDAQLKWFLYGRADQAWEMTSGFRGASKI